MIEIIYEQNIRRVSAAELFKAGEKGLSYDPYTGKFINITKYAGPDIEEKSFFDDKDEKDEKPIGQEVVKDPLSNIKQQLGQGVATNIELLTELDWEKYIEKGRECSNMYGVAGAIFGKAGDDIYTGFLKTAKTLGKMSRLDRLLGLSPATKAGGNPTPVDTSRLERLKRISKSFLKFSLWVLKKKIYGGVLAITGTTVLGTAAASKIIDEYNKLQDEKDTLAKIKKAMGVFEDPGNAVKETVEDAFEASKRVYNSGELLGFPTQADADCFVYGLFGAFAVSRGLKLSRGSIRGLYNTAKDNAVPAFKAFVSDRKASKIIREIAKSDDGWKPLTAAVADLKKTDGLQDIQLGLAMNRNTGDIVYHLTGVPDNLTKEQALVLQDLLKKMDGYNAGLKETLSKSLAREYETIRRTKDYQRMKKLLSQIDDNGNLPQKFLNKRRMLDRLELSRETVVEAEKSLGELKKAVQDLEKFKEVPDNAEDLQRIIWKNLNDGQEPMDQIIDVNDPFQKALHRKLEEEYKLLVVLQTEGYDTGLKTINASIKESGVADPKKFEKQMKETRKRLLAVNTELNALRNKTISGIFTNTLRAGIQYSVGGLGLATVAYVSLDWVDSNEKIDEALIQKAVGRFSDDLYANPNTPMPKDKETLIREILAKTKAALQNHPLERSLIDAILKSPAAITEIGKNFLDEDRKNITGSDGASVAARERISKAISYSINAIVDHQRKEKEDPKPAPEPTPSPQSKGIVSKLPENVELLNRPLKLDLGSGVVDVKFYNVGSFIKDGVIQVGKRKFQLNQSGTTPKFNSIKRKGINIYITASFGAISKEAKVLEIDIQKIFTAAMSIQNVDGRADIKIGSQSGEIVRTESHKQKGTKQMSKLDIRELVKEVLSENSGQGYAKYPYGSSVRDEEQPKEDYIEDWKSLSLELVKDETRDTAIQLAKLLVRDLELFEDVLDLAGQNQSVGEEILRKLKEVREKA
jgi:hypothetical protein